MQLEDARFAAQTLGDMDADVEVEAHLDVASAIDLPHLPNTRLSFEWPRVWSSLAERADPDARRDGR